MNHVGVDYDVDRLPVRYRCRVGSMLPFMPANRLPIAVSVEYMLNDRRVTKQFGKASAAKRFYAQQVALGANPKIVGATAMPEITKTETAKTESPKTTKKVAKKATKKAVKKTTKKVAKKATKKAVKKASKEPKPRGALTDTEVKILSVLKHGKALTKHEIGEKADCRASAKVLGAATREDNGVQGGGLLGKGLIRAEKHEGERLITFVITKAGLKALGATK